MPSLRTATFIVVTSLIWSLAAPPTATSLTGVDLSHWDRVVNWRNLSAGHTAFVFAKATDGRSRRDRTYAPNRTGARAVGLPFGAYHFAQPTGGTTSARTADAIAEADSFVGYARPAAGDLLPVLDLERSGRLSAANLAAWTGAWLTEVQARLGVKPIIYTGRNFWRFDLADTTKFALAGFKLWYARYTRAPNAIAPASNWADNGWTFWQWTGCAHIPGLAHCGDADRFRGRNLARVTIPPAPALPPTVTSAPTIVGTPQSGQLLAAVPGSWTGAKPISFAYQWERCDPTGASCTALPAATSESYRLQPQDADASVAVEVTASNRIGTSTATSSTTPVLPPPNR